jgi:hypothetical protein
MDGTRNRQIALRRDDIPALESAGIITIPGATGSAFDHGIFDAASRRVFVAHTARSTLEVIDRAAGRLLFTGVGRRRT